LWFLLVSERFDFWLASFQFPQISFYLLVQEDLKFFSI